MLSVAAVAIGLVLGAEEPICPPPQPCPACPPCPATPSPSVPKIWTGSVSLGVVAVTGNARSVTASASASAEHKGEQWIFAGKLYGTYGEAQAAGGSGLQVSAENAALFLRADYRVGPRLSTYVLTGFETDHPRSIEMRHSQEAGLGYAWIDWTRGDRKLFLRSDLGLRLAEEYRFQYYPTPGRVDPRFSLLEAPRVAGVLRYEVDKSLLLSQDVEVLPTVGGRLLVNGTTKLSAKLAGPLALGVAYAVNYDSAPPAPKIPWDTNLSVTLDYLF